MLNKIFFECLAKIDAFLNALVMLNAKPNLAVSIQPYPAMVLFSLLRHEFIKSHYDDHQRPLNARCQERRQAPCNELPVTDSSVTASCSFVLMPCRSRTTIDPPWLTLLH